MVKRAKLENMRIAAIIPARYYSARFCGKPLAKIMGISMIERVYHQVLKTKKFTEIIVATDDTRIVKEVKKFGGDYQITSKNAKSGTDRIWEVLCKKQFDAVVNIQGDEPLISEVLISDIYNTLSCGEHDVVTAVSFNISHEDYLSKDIVKVVLYHDFQAMYFSRSPIPFISKENFNGFYQHIGIYGYLKSAIEKFVQYQQADLELAENLEQLRFLANGIIIKAVVSDYQSVGVDIPEDIKKVENIIRTKNEKD